jgi:hypothetical protein
MMQLIARDWLHWTVGCLCPGCGTAFETLGRDGTPAEIREALMARCGLTRLTVEDLSGDSAVALLKVFRQAGASLSEAKASAQLAATSGIEGTRVELELLAQRLREKNLSLTVSASDSC